MFLVIGFCLLFVMQVFSNSSRACFSILFKKIGKQSKLITFRPEMNHISAFFGRFPDGINHAFSIVFVETIPFNNDSFILVSTEDLLHRNFVVVVPAPEEPVTATIGCFLAINTSFNSCEKRASKGHVFGSCIVSLIS